MWPRWFPGEGGRRVPTNRPMRVCPLAEAAIGGRRPLQPGFPAGEDAPRASQQTVGRGLKRLSRYGFARESCPRMAPFGNGRLWMFT